MVKPFTSAGGHILQTPFISPGTSCNLHPAQQRLTAHRVSHGSAAARQRCMPPRRTTATGSRPPLPSQASSSAGCLLTLPTRPPLTWGCRRALRPGPGRNSGDWRGAGLHEWWRAQGGFRSARHGNFLVFYWYLFSNQCSVLLLTAASSCMCSQAGGVREPLRPRAALFPNQAHAGRLRVRSTTTLRRSRSCLTSGLMQTTTTRSRMSVPKHSWLRAQVSAFCPSCVVRLAAACRVAEINLGFRTECRASRLMVCECAQTRVEACDAAPEGSESCNDTCRRLRQVRTRHCASASTRGSCGAWGLEWPVFRTASGCAADEPPYSRSRAGASVADVPALFELRAVGRDGGAASPRVPAP